MNFIDKALVQLEHELLKADHALATISGLNSMVLSVTENTQKFSGAI